MKIVSFILASLLYFTNAALGFNPAADTIQTATPSVQVSTELVLSTGYSNYKNSEKVRKQSLPYELSGSINLVTRSGWTLPVQMLGSSQSYRHSQPYNQMGVSPRYKEWLTLHGGYRSVTFSPLTLAGHRFLGAGIELNPGLLRAGFVVGKFNRALEASTTNPSQIASFKRTGYAARLGVGTRQTYLDVVLVDIADVASSIRPDSSGPGLTPGGNIVLGVSGRIQLQKKWVLELDAAGSAYTRDIRQGEPAESDSTLSPSSFTGRAVRLGKLFALRPATDLRMAVRTSLSYRGQWADLKIRYRLTEPGYQSMGGYYYQQDFENITVAPAVRLFKKAIYIHTSVGWQRDNLANQKKARTNRLISSAMISYTSPRDLTLDLSVSNYGISQQAGFRPLQDTTRLSQNDRTLSGNLWKLWMGRNLTHTFTASATLQKLHDNNRFTSQQNHWETQDYSVNYNLQQGTIGWDLEAGFTYTHTTAQDYGSLYYGPSLVLGHKMLKQQQLRVRVSATYLRSHETFTEQAQSGFVMNTTLSLSYQLTPRQQLRLHHSRTLSYGDQRYLQHQGNIQWSFAF